MAEPRKYTRQTTSTYYDPEYKTNGLQITAWTEDAWNRAQEAYRRYLADLEWQRAHPYLAGMRNFAGNALNGLGNFVNDEIFLNKGNIRVRNAQAHPEVMNAIQSGGNIAGGMVAAPFLALTAAETAPIWAPWALRGARALMTPKGMLAADAAGTLGMTYQQWAPWLFGTAGALSTIPAGQYIAENGVPSISFPRFLSDDAPAADPGQNPDGGALAQPAPALPAAPEPEGGDNNNGNKKWWQKLWETSGEGLPSKWGPRAGRFVRNWGIRVPAYTAIGAPVVDVAGNIISSGLEPDSVQHDWQWKATRMRFMPERTILRGIGRAYMTTPPAAPTDTVPRTAQPAVANPTDTVPGQAQPDSTSYNSFDAELEALRQAYGGN